MKLNLTVQDIDRLRRHARDGGVIKGEELLNLLQDWVTLETEGRHERRALMAQVEMEVASSRKFEALYQASCLEMQKLLGMRQPPITIVIKPDEMEGMPQEASYRHTCREGSEDEA